MGAKLQESAKEKDRVLNAAFKDIIENCSDWEKLNGIKYYYEFEGKKYRIIDEYIGEGNPPTTPPNPPGD